MLFALFIATTVFGTTIHDIQYTENSGQNGYYPSLYVGEIVQIGGIVTGINYNNYGYFIADNSGAWSGIFIYDNTHSPAIGDEILITGEVHEYHGWTELKNIESFETVSNNNELLEPFFITTAEVSEEQFESVLVQLTNAVVTSSYDSDSEFIVDDSSGNTTVSTGFFNFENNNLTLFEGFNFENIVGINTSYNNYFNIHPRNFDDVTFGEIAYLISVDCICFHDVESISVPIDISNANESATVENYQINISYNSEIVSYTNFNVDETLSENGIVTEYIDGNNLQFNFSGNFNVADIGTLLRLNFDAVGNDGYTDLQINSATINGEGVAVNSEIVSLFNNNDPIGDTLTVIQRPILSIPEIVTPAEQMQILCNADASTSNWQANLIFNGVVLEIPIISSNYDSNSEMWTLTTEIPTPDLYELYDLQITASNGIWDVAKNSVQLIPIEKDEYYFIHITDTHLPTYTYWGNEPEVAVSDTTTMIYLRKVIHDVNLLNPEFVLLTGDVINEGELEDFQNGRVYTKAKRILGEFEVPVYLVAGNHDIGGWDSTPVQQGSARRNWWRFFGWKSLESEAPYTQNYTFNYKNILFLGMEAYDNYDSWNFDVYEEDSFIPQQLEWLDSQLANATNYDARVLFYHYDFSDQVNLNQLGVEMSLWGHTHGNHNDFTPPYDICTDNVCQSNPAYRVIKVNNNVLSPCETSYTQSNGNGIYAEYSPANDGLADSITATVHSNQNIDFDNIKLKFVMPFGNTNYNITNGTLYQIDTSGEFNICYVNANLSANSEVVVTIEGISNNYGDVNFDGIVNIQDVILTVNFALGFSTPSTDEMTAADMNGDGNINVQDVILVVNLILGS